MGRWMAIPCLLGLAGVAALAADSPNLVQNAGLEAPLGEGGLPEGWFRFAKPEGGYKFAVASGGHTGEKCLVIEGDGEYAGVGTAQTSFDADKQYAARGWVKVEGGEGTLCTVKLDYFAENGDYLASSAYEQHLKPGATGWRPISVIGRATDAPAAKKIGIALALGGKGKAWFDDLEFVTRPAPADSLLRFGSVEDVVGDQPYGYRSFFAEGGKGTLSVSADDPKDGWYTLHVKGDSQWVVTAEEKRPIEKGKTYTFRGWARARTGTAQIKFDYFKGDEWIGQSVSDDQTEDTWKRFTVQSELGNFPEATHLAPTVVAAGGQYDARFDALTLVAK